MSEKPLTMTQATLKDSVPLHVRVAEALGWHAYLEKRGEYEPAVTQRPGEIPPWERLRDPARAKLQYREVSCREAQACGFFGREFPRYDTSWEVTGLLIEQMRFRIAPIGDCSVWRADLAEDGSDGAEASTPLLAVCALILALSEAGKLERTEAAK